MWNRFIIANALVWNIFIIANALVRNRFIIANAPVWNNVHNSLCPCEVFSTVLLYCKITAVCYKGGESWMCEWSNKACVGGTVALGSYFMAAFLPSLYNCFIGRLWFEHKHYCISVISSRVLIWKRTSRTLTSWGHDLSACEDLDRLSRHEMGGVQIKYH